MQKILLTGSNGFIGQKLLDTLLKQADCALTALSRGPNRYSYGGDYVYQDVDVCDAGRLREVVYAVRPTVIIHTVAMAQVDACEQNPGDCHAINVVPVQLLVDLCVELGAKLIYLSTDFIFDGHGGPYQEEDEPCPLNVYGRSKWRAEQIIQQAPIAWAIVRTILVYGFPHEPERSNFVLWVKRALEAKQSIQVVTDHIRMPTLVDDLVEACVQIVKRNKVGIFHISGPEMLSMYAIAQAAADFWQMDACLIQPVLSADLPGATVRPSYTGFVLTKAERDLGYRPRSLKAGLTLIDQQIQAFNNSLHRQKKV